MVQWLRLCASSSGNTGSIPGQGTKFPQASWHNQTKKKKLKQNKTKAEVAALIYNIADFGARKFSGIKKGIT